MLLGQIPKSVRESGRGLGKRQWQPGEISDEKAEEYGRKLALWKGKKKNKKTKKVIGLNLN